MSGHVYGDQRWPGTMSGGSMKFVSPTRQTPDSPWMNFGRNGVWLLTNYVETAGWSEFWAEDASTYRRHYPHFLESSCVMLSPKALGSVGSSTRDRRKSFRLMSMRWPCCPAVSNFRTVRVWIGV